MIEARLADGTVLRFPEGTDQDVIDRTVKKHIQSSKSTPQQVEEDDPSVIEDVAKSLGSGVVRGAIGLAELPEMAARGVLRLGQEGLQAAGIADEDYNIPVLDTATGRALRGATTLEDYRPKTTAGEYAGTVGEFLPGAIGGPAGLAKRLGTMAVAGAGSEAAGQLTEGSVLEPVARVAGAFAPSAVVSGAKKAISPYSGIDQRRLEMSDFLESKGVGVTAGQKIGSESLKRKESLGKKGQEFRETQIEEFTAAAMKEIGSKSKVATADALQEAQERIGGQINSATKDIKIRATYDDIIPATNAMRYFNQAKPIGDEGREAAGIFSEINKTLINSSSKGKVINGPQYKAIRQKLSKSTTSSDEATRETAKRMLNIFDDMIDRHLSSFGRSEDIQKLKNARSQYRDYLAIEKAVSGTGEAKNIGLITPSSLGSALRQQGRRAFVQEKRGDLGKLAKSGEAIATFPKSSGTAENITAIVGGLRGALVSGSAGAAISALVGLPPWVGATVATIGPATFNRLLASKSGQKYLVNQFVKNSNNSITPDVARTIIVSLASQINEQEQ